MSMQLADNLSINDNVVKHSTVQYVYSLRYPRVTVCLYYKHTVTLTYLGSFIDLMCRFFTLIAELPFALLTVSF